MSEILQNNMCYCSQLYPKQFRDYSIERIEYKAHQSVMGYPNWFRDYYSQDIYYLSHELNKFVNVKEINLNGQQLTTEYAIFYKFCKFIKNNTKLEVLNVNGCNIHDTALYKLLKCLNMNIRKLYIRCCKMNEKCVDVLVEYMNKNTTLEKLDISNSFDEKLIYMCKFMNILSYNRTLKKLILRGSYLSKENLKKMVDALKMNDTLEYLFMENTYLGDEGAYILSELIRETKTLKYIDISFCQIKAEGMKSISKAYKNNQSILAITIHNFNRDMTDESWKYDKKIQQYIKRNCHNYKHINQSLLCKLLKIS